MPDTVGPIRVEADLRARLLRTSVEVKAPREGRPKTRTNWMLRQLQAAPEDVLVETRFAGSKETTTATLGEAREQPERLLSPTDAKRPPRGFTISQVTDLGTKRGKGPGSFVHSTKQQAAGFYRDVVQNLQTWRPKAPALQPDPEPPEPPADTPTQPPDTDKPPPSPE